MRYNLRMSCKVCSHPRRTVIDDQLLRGVALRTIIAAISFDPPSLGGLSRHRKHVREMLGLALKERTEEESAEHGSDLLARVQKLADEAIGLLETAKASSNLKAGTAAICAAVRCLELCGRLDGSLAQPHAPGIHLTLNRTLNVTNYGPGSDEELAELLFEALNGFDPRTVERFRQIALRQKGLPACTDIAPPSESHLDSTI